MYFIVISWLAIYEKSDLPDPSQTISIRVCTNFFSKEPCVQGHLHPKNMNIYGESGELYHFFPSINLLIPVC